MTYVPLPIVDVPVEDLRLDLENYRIPVRPDDELAALRYLFASEEVVDQAKLFLRDGYFDNEVPIVVEENGEYVVLEGNRRVSALKAIQDPALVPEHEHDVQLLLTRYAAEVPDMPTVIRVIVAEDREAARPHIARLHTGIPKKRWSRDQQANYYHSVLGPGVNVEDLKAMYPDVGIVRFLRMVEIRKFLGGVKFKDKSLHDYVQSDELKMSSFEYAYRVGEIAQAFGVVFDGYQITPKRKTSRAVGSSLTPQQLAALEYLMQRFRAGTLNTRSAELKKDTDERAALIARLQAGEVDDPAAPPPGAGDGGDSPDSDPPEGDPEGDPDPDEPDDDPGGGGKRGPNNPDTKRGFDIGGLPTSGLPSNLKRRYIELREIDVRKTPTAAAMLLRLVLEGTIKRHFAGSPHKVSGELKPCVDRLNEVYGKQKAHRDVINTIRSGAAAVPGSQNWFNAASHNPDFPVTEADARKAYSLVESVFNLLLTPYQP